MGWGDKTDRYGSAQQGEIPLKGMGMRKEPFVMPPSTEGAEKQLKSSSAPKWVVFKLPHPDRAIAQLLCTERGRGWAHTHAFLGRVFAYSRYLSPSSLPRQLLGGMGGRMTVRAGIRWLSRDVVVKQGHGGRGTTW